MTQAELSRMARIMAPRGGEVGAGNQEQLDGRELRGMGAVVRLTVAAGCASQSGSHLSSMPASLPGTCQVGRSLRPSRAHRGERDRTKKLKIRRESLVHRYVYCSHTMLMLQGDRAEIGEVFKHYVSADVRQTPTSSQHSRPYQAVPRVALGYLSGMPLTPRPL
jgi:hypothetical protein